jgi:glucose/arabinose dehydrogenase
MTRIVFALAAMAVAWSAPSAAQTTRVNGLLVDTVLRDLEHPWALAFLPDGRMLVTERPGRLRIIAADGRASEPVSGVPRVFARGQGGLHDVILDRDHARNRTIYFCYAEPFEGGGRTAMARARLSDAEPPRFDDVQVIFRQQGPPSRGNHFGCRIVQLPDDSLVLTLGDHFTDRDRAQNLGDHIGKTVRLRPDGSVPPDNPFVGRAGALPEIWTWGHRNPQGAALHAPSGRVWMHEHGPRGGDEVNVLEPGRNYGWPVIGYGVDYSGATIHASTHKDGMEQPIHHWTPSIAPSGMAFHSGKGAPAWRNNLFVGALASRFLVRLQLDGQRIVKEERLLADLGFRIRDVREGPDGSLWLLTDSGSGRLLRVRPSG